MPSRRSHLRLGAVSLLVGLLGVVYVIPSRAAAPDPLYPLVNLLSLLTGPLAPTTRFANDIYANPAFLPDWDRNGNYGDAGDVASEQAGAPAEAAFLYPCIADDGAVTYETTTGSCAAAGTVGATFRRGIAKRFKVIDARGFALTAVLWLPDVALQPGAAGLPGLVFANGAFVAQRSFYMYDMTAARAGFVVLSYDSQGQGTSEASFPEHAASAPASGPCTLTSMSCRELQEMVRWFTGAPITPVGRQLGSHNPAYEPVGENPVNPALGVLDLAKVAIAGESMGSISVTNYLHFAPTGRDADGKPLPAVAAAVGLSGFGPAKASVPVQVQTADLDIPGITDTNFLLNATDGPVGTKAWYDSLRRTGQGNAMVQLLIQEGGSHGDSSNIPLAPHAVWAWAWSTDYFVNFLSCHAKKDAAACPRAAAPRAHLSKAFASEYDPDGPAGPSASRCVSIPSQVSLGMVVDPLRLVKALLGLPTYNCQP